MNDLDTARHAQPPARMLAGALAHLAKHMESGCPRAAYLATMLLEQVIADPQTDPHLRHHARQLVEILERDPLHVTASDALPTSRLPADLGWRGAQALAR
ncbi:MAG: hypothetical protein V4713_16620 [Pseudomonadota bacterium]